MGVLTWFGRGRHARARLHDSAEPLIEALSARDPVTGQHVNRVACIATEIGMLDGLGEQELLPVEVGARLHDVGKLGIPDAILKKPDRLTDEEWTVMRRHPEFGAALVQTVPELAHLAATIEAHHERWDGGGYPRGLTGEAIPMAARIFAIADSIDAMTSDRPYQRGRDWAYVSEELQREGGKQWDPRLSELTLASLDRIRQLELGCPHGGIDGKVAS